MHTTSVTLSAGWISTLTHFGTDTKSLIFNIAIPVLCGLFVVVTGWKSKAAGPTIMAVILAGVVWGLSSDMGTLKDKTTSTVNEYDGGPTTLQGDQ
ncbi:hypothetical protein [Streptomyces sp. NBC_01465]|uniref:hypothetical protein n=1 Tax=Streptomyces sp. NBC_01465 TaxID=2903878 RepID=UPI002E366C2B|nr:hypothetical protein [Streptomyces sp. NBC_01465]